MIEKNRDDFFITKYISVVAQCNTFACEIFEKNSWIFSKYEFIFYKIGCEREMTEKYLFYDINYTDKSDPPTHSEIN